MPKDIVLEDNEAAIIIGPDGKHQMYLPNYSDDETVLDSTTIVLTLGILMKREDEGFQQYLAEKWNEIVKESLSEEEWNELKAENIEAEASCVPEADKEGA
jgi:hypothetical protein